MKTPSLKTVLVYDSNNLESLITAAAIASIRDVETCDCRSLLPVADHYVWIGVVPTIYYFGVVSPEVLKTAKNTAIVNITTSHGLKDIKVNGVEYAYSTTGTPKSDDLPELNVVNNYGSRGILERALIYFKEPPENFAYLVYIVKQFYEPLAALDLLQLTTLNAKEALHCLTHKDKLFIPIVSSAASLDSAEEAYEDYDIVAKLVLKDRWTNNWIKTADNDKPKTVMTFYEQTLWWFIRRRILRKDIVVRNISVSATGTIVTSALPYVQGIRGTDPVFVY